MASREKNRPSKSVKKKIAAKKGPIKKTAGRAGKGGKNARKSPKPVRKKMKKAREKGLHLYNSLTKRKEIFRPEGKEVKMYNCGPTVYNFAHIGNFRSYLVADLLRRYLEWKGFRIKQIMNITDVGHMTVDDSLQLGGVDKIEEAARQKGLSPKEISDFYTMAFFEDISKLNLLKAWFYPRASDHIVEMQKIISGLLKKGLAYQRGGSIYFDIQKFPGYGKLSGNTIKKLQAGKRVKIISEKKNPLDFALWIRNPKHLMQWESPWGRGYPGWHIECSAMSMEYLGHTLDIHTGGEDNIFPHHECEIAQSEGFTGKPFSRHWLHVRHLLVDGKKMSKSLGNFYTLRDLLKNGYSSRAIRFLLISAHYRTRLNFTERGLKAAEETLKSLDNFVSRMAQYPSRMHQSEEFSADPSRMSQSGAISGKENLKFSQMSESARKKFEQAMDDDLNISEGLAVLFDFVGQASKLAEKGQIGGKNSREAVEFIMDLDKVLGIGFEAGREWHSIQQAEERVRSLLLQREEFRQNKNWPEADRIRKVLAGMGIEVEDTKSGPKWREASG